MGILVEAHGPAPRVPCSIGAQRLSRQYVVVLAFQAPQTLLVDAGIAYRGTRHKASGVNPARFLLDTNAGKLQSFQS